MEKSWRVLKSSPAASLLVVLGILAWRKTDAFLNPQFWAEDGTVFFQQAYGGGFESLWTTYAGYYHLLPRLIAWLATFAPFEIIPAIYNFAALLAMWSVVMMLHSPRLQLRWPLAFSLPLVLVPHFTGEVFMNLTNMQWPLAILLLLTVLQEEPRSWRGFCADALILFWVGLSTPLIVLTLPILFVRVWQRRSRWWIMESALALAVSALQVFAFWQQPTVLAASPSYQPSAWVELLGWKTFGTFFLGRKLPYEYSASLLLAVGIVLLGWMIWRLSGLAERHRLAFPGLAFGLATCVLAFFKFRDAVDLLVPAAAAIRYFYIPWVMVCWSLIILLLEDRAWGRWIAGALLLVILHSSLTTVFRAPPFQDYAWSSHAPALEAREHVWIPINPPGWRIKVNEPESPTAED